MLDFQCLGGVHVVVVVVWSYSGTLQIRRPHLQSVHLEQQASMRLPLMHCRSVHRVEDDIGYTCFTVNVGGGSARLVSIVDYTDQSCDCRHHSCLAH